MAHHEDSGLPETDAEKVARLVRARTVDPPMDVAPTGHLEKGPFETDEQHAARMTRLGHAPHSVQIPATALIKDSGKRVQFEGGMQRDTNEGKPRPDLVRDGPMLWRWIMHLTAGAQKYDARNWLKAVHDPAALERAYESCDRHYEQWRRGDTDEDHAAAVFFNINEIEYIKEHNGGTDTS